MHIVIKTVDIGSIQAIVMVATDENLVAIRQVAKPVEKVYRFLLGPDHTEIAGMNHYIGIGQILQPMMRPMRV